MATPDMKKLLTEFPIIKPPKCYKCGSVLVTTKYWEAPGGPCCAKCFHQRKANPIAMKGSKNGRND